MSYLRSGWPHRFVDGISKDYLFISSHIEDEKEVLTVEDYGNTTNEGIIEMLCERMQIDEGDEGDEMLKWHLIKLLAERLNVNMRDKPLTRSEAMDIMLERVKEVEVSRVKREAMEKWFH